MLGKLIKHEILSVKNGFLGIYALVITAALLCRMTMFFTKYINNPQINSFLSGIVSGLSVSVAAVAFTVWIIITLTRFQDNLLKDEGYLMHTLPVQLEYLVFSKLLTSLIFLFTTVAAVYLEYSILHGSLTYLVDSMLNAFQTEFAGQNIPFAVFGCSFIVLLQTILLISAFYMCLSTGYRFPNNQDVAACGILILSWVFYQSVTVLLIFEAATQLNTSQISDNSYFTWIFSVGSICPAIASILCLWITIHNMKKHLNLS